MIVGGWSDGVLLCWGVRNLRGLWVGGWGTVARLCPFSLGVCLLGCLCPHSRGGRGRAARRGPPRAHTCVARQGEFRVAERKITMEELLRALQEGRVREVFGSGTACQVCPVHQILYQGKVRWGCHWRREGRRGFLVLMAQSSPALARSHHGKRA